MAKVPEHKKKIVEEMLKLMRQYHIIGLVNMSNLPAPQLQSMRREMGGKVNLFMTKKRLMKVALEKIKDEKKNIAELEKYFEGMPALIFTNENPFKLSRLLQKSKTSAPAKAGQIAPNDIIINKGPTPFAPGPIISELSAVGLKVGVESGKVAVKEDAVVAKKGEKIKPKVAEILTRLDIKPMMIGLGLVATYEDGIIYQKDILEVDEKAFNQKVNLAALEAFNLAFNITYITKDNVNLLLAKAFNDAKALGISREIFDKGIIEELLGKAEMQTLSLKNTANIEVKTKEIIAKEEAEAAKRPEQVEEEPKEETKEEKKEEEALEEEKEILKEEQELEEKPKQGQTPEEKEVQEAVKEEEEIQLERERLQKEKEIEQVEKEKIKPEPEKEPREEVDKKVEKIVEQTKKFAEGKEETAADIIEEVKKEEAQEEKKEKAEAKEKKDKTPSAHDLKKQKEEKAKEQDKERKKVEDLTKELLKKGTLRKK